MDLLERFWGYEMSSFERYSAYKDSGIEWLGEIPKNWDITIVKHVLRKLERPRKKNGNTVICSNHGYSKLLGDVKQGLVSLTQYDYQGVNEGDLLVHGMDAWHGAISISKHIGDCTSVVHVCDSKHNKTYIAYFLKMLAIMNVYKVISNGVRQNTSDFRSWQKFGDIQILLPPKQEQQKIASFLDKKTKQLDQAIEQKEQLIELLKERRQILINDAVTKGLDRTVSFKDSGVEWIGEIPEGWDLVPGFTVYKENKTKNIGMKEDKVLSLSYGKLVVKPKEKLTGLVPESFETYQIVKPRDIIIR